MLSGIRWARGGYHRHGTFGVVGRSRFALPSGEEARRTVSRYSGNPFAQAYFVHRYYGMTASKLRGLRKCKAVYRGHLNNEERG